MAILPILIGVSSGSLLRLDSSTASIGSGRPSSSAKHSCDARLTRARSAFPSFFGESLFGESLASAEPAEPTEPAEPAEPRAGHSANPFT
ncbi:hypothetical protein GCM10009837_34150 [Streptomyces durmitorensis]